MTGAHGTLKAWLVILGLLAALLVGYVVADTSLPDLAASALGKIGRFSEWPLLIPIALAILAVALTRIRHLMLLAAVVAYFPITINAGANITPSDFIALTIVLSFLATRPKGAIPLGWPHLAAALYLAAGVLSILSPTAYTHSLTGALKLIEWAIIIYFTFSRLVDLDLSWRIIRIMGALTALTALIFYQPGVGRLSDLIIGSNRNYVASVFALGAPLLIGIAVYYRRRSRPGLYRLALAGAAFTTLAAIISGSRASGAGVVAALLLLLCARAVPRKTAALFKVLPALFLAVSLFVATDSQAWLLGSLIDTVTGRHDTASARVAAAQLAWDTFTSHPVFGVGYGSYPAYITAKVGPGVFYQGNPISEPHNFLLYIAAEMGIVGIAAFMLVFQGAADAAGVAVRHGFDDDIGLAGITISCALFGYLTRSLFDLFDVRGTGTMFWLLLGASYALACVMRAEERAAHEKKGEIALRDGAYHAQRLGRYSHA